jgi:hypothetical protein
MASTHLDPNLGQGVSLNYSQFATNNDENFLSANKSPIKAQFSKKHEDISCDYFMGNFDSITPFAEKFEEKVTLFSGIDQSKDYAISMKN